MIAVILAKNEADVIGYTVANLFAQGCDSVLVADNLSTDATAEVARAAGASILIDSDPGHHQAEKMNRLIAGAAGRHEWVIPCDADELWSGLHRLDGFDVARAAPLVHVPHESDDDDPNPFLRITHRQPHPEPHPKVCFRYQHGVALDEGNHYVTGAGPRTTGVDVRHFQYRTLEQVARKVRDGSKALLAAGKPRSTGQHWHDLADLDDERLAAWWADYCRQPTIHDPAPWRR